MNESAPSRRDSFVLSLYLFLVIATNGFLQPFQPLYMGAVGLTKSQIGLAIGIGSGLALLFQPFLGRLSDRLDTRRPFIVGSAVAAGIAFTSYTTTSGFWQILLLTAIGANGTMYLNAVGGVLVGRMVSAARSGGVYARYRVWGSVGYIVVSLLSGLVIGASHGTRIPRAALDPIFRFGPILFLVVAVLAFLLPDPKQPHRERVRPPKEPIEPNLARFLLSYFLYGIALYGSIPYLSLYLQQLGANGSWITGVFSIGVVVEVLVMTQSGALSDVWGRRPALAVAFILLPLRLLLYVPATGPMWIAGVQTMHGFNFGIVGAVAVAFANDLSGPNSKGLAQGRLAATLGLAGAMGPALFGVVSQLIGLRLMFGVASAIAVVAAVVLVFSVDDSHPSSRSIGHRYRWLAWLDRPPTGGA